MRNRCARVMMVAAGLWLAVATVSGQAPYRAPCTGDGKPNLNGIWQALNTANWDIETHSALQGLVSSLGASNSVPGGLGVVDGEIPYRPEALAKKKENFANRLKLDPEIMCYLPGVPRATYMPYPFQIMQGPRHIMIVHEFAGAVRTIYMDKKDQIEAPADSWMGWSHGRWEGDTLVVDTKGFLDSTWFDRAGNYHSDALHAIERFTAREPRDTEVRGDDRGSEGIHAAVEDEHAALSSRGTQRAAVRISVRAVCGRRDLGPPPQAGHQLKNARLSGVASRSQIGCQPRAADS